MQTRNCEKKQDEKTFFFLLFPVDFNQRRNTLLRVDSIIICDHKTQRGFKLASKVLLARAESCTESDDTSYASESSSTESTSTVTESSASPSKASIQHLNMAIPHSKSRIIIKYSATIDSPKPRPPLAIIGTVNSETSVESDFSDDDEEDETESESEESSEESETEIDSEESEEEDEETEQIISNGHTKTNGYTNGVRKVKGYDLDDFKILKTIGELSADRMTIVVISIFFFCPFFV